MIVIFITVTVPIIIFISYMAETEKEYSFAKENVLLLDLAATIDRKIDKREFSEIVKRPIGVKEKSLLLHEAFQPVISEMSVQYPRYGMGIAFDPEDNIVALGTTPFKPEYFRRFSDVSAELDTRKVYESGMPDYVTLSQGPQFKEHVYGIYYPIVDRDTGKVIGIIWVSAKVNDVEQEYYAVFLKGTAITFMLWLATTLLILQAFSRLKKGIGRLEEQIKLEDYNTVTMREFPELLPVLETIKSQLANEYIQKEKIREEMAALDRLNLIGQMAAGISHEVRNPMTTVRGYLQLLERKPEYQKHKDTFEVMISELDRANEIITDFLAIGKPTHARKGVADIDFILNTLRPLLEAEALREGVDLHFAMTELPAIEVNSQEIRQLVLNLVKNAIEASPAAGVVTIRTSIEDSSAVLAIEDRGPGIDQNIIDKIGTPFVTTKPYGTGLGLAVCYGIAARHNAILSFETSEAGTTFYVKFCLN